jgi:hypothetical protein
MAEFWQGLHVLRVASLSVPVVLCGNPPKSHHTGHMRPAQQHVDQRQGGVRAAAGSPPSTQRAHESQQAALSWVSRAAATTMLHPAHA